MSAEQPTIRFLVTSDLALLQSLRFQKLLYFRPELINYEGHWLSPKDGVPPRILAILLMHGGNPIGCIAGLFKRSDREFEINAWILQSQLINKGLGQNLLTALENHLTNTQACHLTINFRDDLSAKAAIKHILNKQQWISPEVPMHICKMVVTPETHSFVDEHLAAKVHFFHNLWLCCELVHRRLCKSSGLL
ncbi:MAG: GNAT family N-acetyltransferase [Methylococcaceae bacterium]